MIEDSVPSEEEIEDQRLKFKEALEKKKKKGSIRNNNIAGTPKIHGDQSSAQTPKMFRRKSGSA